MASNQITAIISDLGGVLVDVDKKNMCAKLARHSSLPAAGIGRHLSGLVVHSSGDEQDLSKGIISPVQFYEAMSEKLKLRLDFASFKRIYSDRFARKEGSLLLLRKLSGKYQVAMLSNTNELHYEYWKKLLGNDMKLFRAFVLSFEAGLAKPQPEIYLEAARRLGISPKSCVFIDDVMEYVEAARKAGMRGIRFTSAAQLETDLKRMEVSF